MSTEETESDPRIPQPIREPEETEKPAKGKKEAAAPQDLRVEGFLVPEFYRRQAVYKTHPLFRATLLILVVAVFVGISGGYQWMLASKLNKTAAATQRLEIGESTRLQNQALLLKATREKYKELEILQKQLRIPLAPILDAMEKSIPKEISINDFSMTCQPVATAGSTKRQANIRITVFFPSGVAPTDPAMNAWPEKIQEVLNNTSKGSLRLKQAEWGAQQALMIPGTKRSPEVKGWTRPLSFTIELDTQKL
jgi:hypothetical protein